MFEAPTDVSFSIHKWSGYGKADGTLTFSWQLQGHFNISMDGGWHYVIKTSDFRNMKCPARTVFEYRHQPVNMYQCQFTHCLIRI